MKKYLLLPVCAFIAIALSAQSFEEQQDLLRILMEQAAEERDSTQKTAKMEVFARKLEEVLRQEGSMNVSFVAVPHMGTLVSADKKVRLFTWNLPLTATRHKYYGILQYRSGKTAKTAILTDVKDALSRPETASLKNGEWFGSLYYQLVDSKSGSTVFYTLIGFDFHEGATNRKIIDVLTFDDAGNPVFGHPVFDNGRWKACRVILEYATGSQFYLNYLPRKKMIVYQRLETITLPDKSRPGRAPSDVFDGLIFKDGRWLLHKDVPLKPKDFS